ncbi:MAG: hypothetical protein Q9O74_07540 [Planctomycetota bacterium]|nr:hypothetical protein [Planctomycetota bacterium]
MNAERSRQIFAQLAIAAAICGGLYAFVGSPLREQMLEAEAELATVLDQGAQAQVIQVALPALLEQQETTRIRGAEIEARSLPGSDESISFSGIMRLADEAGVKVRQVTPVSAASRGNAAPEEAEHTRAGDKASRFTIAGVGSYTSTAAFLDLLGSPWAYSSIKQCRVAPDFSIEGGDGVSFSCTLELFAFDASPVDLGAAPPNPAEGSK